MKRRKSVNLNTLRTNNSLTYVNLYTSVSTVEQKLCKEVTGTVCYRFFSHRSNSYDNLPSVRLVAAFKSTLELFLDSEDLVPQPSQCLPGHSLVEDPPPIPVGTTHTHTHAYIYIYHRLLPTCYLRNNIAKRI